MLGTNTGMEGNTLFGAYENDPNHGPCNGKPVFINTQYAGDDPDDIRYLAKKNFGGDITWAMSPSPACDGYAGKPQSEICSCGSDT